MLSAENSSAANPAGAAHRTTPEPLAGGEGLLPLPKNPTPFGLGRSHGHAHGQSSDFLPTSNASGTNRIRLQFDS